MSKGQYTVALAGNPNVGKSTIFNTLTGLRRHTGNWSGKTVDNAFGEYAYNGEKYSVYDLPGTYSTSPLSKEEAQACGFLESGAYDALVIVLDAVNIERNLRFAADVLNTYAAPSVVCINMIDEAAKKGVKIDITRLSALLQAPVITASARNGDGIDNLKAAVSRAVKPAPSARKYSDDAAKLSAKAFENCCSIDRKYYDRTDRRIDRLVLSKTVGTPIMLLMLLGIFWLTIVGANYPSEWLSEMFAFVGSFFDRLICLAGCSEKLRSLLIDGIYTTLTWVISVMLPPMMIFFPLFTLLEDSGLLPRIAFKTDTCFKCAGAHGKQALTTAMGFGCNACAVTNCRIIEDRRERLTAIITNSLTPCNGRFPMIITLITIFFCVDMRFSAMLRAAVLVVFIVLSFLVTLIASKLLSATILKGSRSPFIMELPPYRLPRLGKVITESMLNRTIFVLLRAAAAAAPAGLFIWLLTNIRFGGQPLITLLTELLDPLGRLIGLDGVILSAFLLGMPANEIVLPIAMMIYMSGNTMTELPETAVISEILDANGWTVVTVLCVIVFSMFHFPCSTTLITIYKETRSAGWTLFSFIYPLAIGSALCFFIHLISIFVGYA